jgi:hypothetical protein
VVGGRVNARSREGGRKKGLCDLKFVCGESIDQSRCMNLKQ